MFDLKRILIPTDFSKYAEAALPYAKAFAEKFGAELFLLHVVQDLAVFMPDMITGTAPVMPDFQQLTGAVHAAFERVIKDHGLGPLSVHGEVREGVAFYEIVRFAQEANIDLIIMSTHGRTGLAHVLLGSVAEKVVRKAPCPVLTVRHPEHEFVHPARDD